MRTQQDVKLKKNKKLNFSVNLLWYSLT